MRILLLFVAFVLIVGIVLVMTGVVHLNRDGNGAVSLTSNVTLGTETRNIQLEVPKVTVGGNGQ